VLAIGPCSLLPADCQYMVCDQEWNVLQVVIEVLRFFVKKKFSGRTTNHLHFVIFSRK
jgi:hypothetical protein